MAALVVLSILMCGFGLLAGASNLALMTFIAVTPKLRKLTFGKLLLNLAVSGGKFKYLHILTSGRTIFLLISY